MRVSAGQQTIAELEHLTFDTGSGKKVGTGLKVVERFGCGIP